MKCNASSLIFKCILSLLLLFIVFSLYYFFFFLVCFLIAPFSSLGILEHCVCPVTWGDEDVYVSVLIYSSDVK